MAARDAASDDPFLLPWERGLMSYWVRNNSWSIDGLPGLKQSVSRISAEDIQTAMKEVGIRLRGPLKMRKATASRSHELSLLVVGLLLGMLFMAVLQRRAYVGPFPAVPAANDTILESLRHLDTL